MLFSEIGDVLEDLSRNKQRLTLSHRAYSTLLHDDGQKVEAAWRRSLFHSDQSDFPELP